LRHRGAGKSRCCVRKKDDGEGAAKTIQRGCSETVLGNEYPVDVIEIDYNFRRVMATGQGGKMVIVAGTSSFGLVKTT
jgi:hypothetical protein